MAEKFICGQAYFSEAVSQFPHEGINALAENTVYFSSAASSPKQCFQIVNRYLGKMVRAVSLTRTKIDVFDASGRIFAKRLQG